MNCKCSNHLFKIDTQFINPLIFNSDIDYQWVCCSQNVPKATFAFKNM